MMKYIKANMDSETTFYKITLNDLKQAFSNENAWLLASINNLGFRAIDIDSLIGSRVIDNVLYLCVTNGVDIDVNGKQADPEDALFQYNLDDLSEYVEDATEDIILANIDEYNMKPPNYDSLASDLISDGYTFTELVDYYLQLVD